MTFAGEVQDFLHMVQFFHDTRFLSGKHSMQLNKNESRAERQMSCVYQLFHFFIRRLEQGKNIRLSLLQNTWIGTIVCPSALQKSGACCSAHQASQTLSVFLP